MSEPPSDIYTTDPERKELRLPTIPDVYTEIKRLERDQEPSPNDIISTGRITEDDPEYEQLIEAGASKAEFEKGKLKRKSILEAGYVFNNMPLGILMEKPLIAAEIDGADYSQRKFLTAEELERVKQYQAQHNDVFGLQGFDIEVLREDMLGFMLAAEDPRSINDKYPVPLLRRVRKHVGSPSLDSREKFKNWKNSKEADTSQLDAQLVSMHWDYLKEEEKSNRGEGSLNPHYLDQRFMKENCQDIYPWEEINEFAGTETRGVRISMIESRKTALSGIHSPYLDSGYRFSNIIDVNGFRLPIGNPDVTVNLEDGTVFRVNMLSFHLLSRGVSEMGASDVSYDQDYTTGNYVKSLFEGSDPIVKDQDLRRFHARLKFDTDELQLQIRRRLIEEARKWAQSNDAPKKAKLVELIRRLKR